MAILVTIAAALAGYVLGSLPVGVLVCRPLGKDPRRVASGRTGGTNVWRTAGLPAAALTVVGDFMKGYAAAALAPALFDLARGALAPSDLVLWLPWATMLAGAAAVLGHNHSAFLGFRGGAGTATNVGACLRIEPATAIAAVVAAVGMLVGARYASLASLTASDAIFAGLTWRVLEGALPPAGLAYAILQFALVATALRPNIARLLAGTERRIGGRPSTDTTAAPM